MPPPPLYLFARAPREYKADHYLTFTFINSFGDKIFPAARERERVSEWNLNSSWSIVKIYARVSNFLTCMRELRFKRVIYRIVLIVLFILIERALLMDARYIFSYLVCITTKKT